LLQLIKKKQNLKTTYNEKLLRAASKKNDKYIFFRGRRKYGSKDWTNFATKNLFYISVSKQNGIFFYGGRSLNLGPCIFYALSLPTELSSRGQLNYFLKKSYFYYSKQTQNIFWFFFIKSL